MNHLTRATLISSAGVLFLLATPSVWAQTPTLNYWNVAAGNWSVTGNWSRNQLPDGQPQNGDDFAVIGGTSGGTGVSSGTATIDSAISQMPGGIQLGVATANSGTLQVSSGGSLTVATTAFVGDGSVTVGVAGTGTLNVDRGGSLTAVTLNSGGSTSSLVRLGATTGTGTAVVSVGSANLARTTRVVGPNVDFTSTNLSLSGALIDQISATSHSALKATDLAILGGTLSFQFNTGFTPALGNSWDVINARQLAGAFTSVDTSTAPPLPLGQVYNLRTQSGGLGNVVSLAVEERLVLNVNRATHAVSISNPGTTSISIDGYSVHSAALNELNPGNFSPLGGTWEIANATTGRVNQLNPTAAPTFATGSSTSIGNIFAPPTPANFGDTTEDLSFEYTQPDGSIRTGVVNYTGTKGINNFVLRVDPATGKAQLRNPSLFAASIDGYTVSSTLGSLDTTNWNSLDDQNAAGGDWQEADISANRVSELKFAGAASVSSGQLFDMGNLFNTAIGKRDLIFQYLLQGESTARTGVVAYESILPGDYDGNGTVDARDYVLWRKSPSMYGGTSGYTDWRKNFGRSAPSSSSLIAAPAVPEPASFALVVVGACLICSAAPKWRSRRRDDAPSHVSRN